MTNPRPLEQSLRQRRITKKKYHKEKNSHFEFPVLLFNLLLRCVCNSAFLLLSGHSMQRYHTGRDSASSQWASLLRQSCVSQWALLHHWIPLRCELVLVLAPPPLRHRCCFSLRLGTDKPYPTMTCWNRDRAVFVLSHQMDTKLYANIREAFKPAYKAW